MRMSELEFAQERLNTATNISLAASHVEAKARAEVARLSLLKLVEKYPATQAFTLEVSYEYDDEGGYFPTVSVYAEVDEKFEYEIADELIEVQHNMDTGTVELLRGSASTCPWHD